MTNLNKNVKRILAIVTAGVFFSCLGVTEVFAAPKYVKITGDPVAVRENAGTSAKFVRQVRNGNYLVYLSEKNDAGGTRWYQVKLSDGKKGWVTSVYSETVDEKNVGQLEVTAALLNVRAGASLSSALLGTARIGSQFVYFSTKTDDSDQLWYLIQYNGEQTAWLLGTYCKVITDKTDTGGKTQTEEKTTGKTVEITGNWVNIRSKASLSGEKLAATTQGKKYEYLASGQDEKGQIWYKIKYKSDKAGWILGAFGKIADSETKTTTVKQVQITAGRVVVRKSASTSAKSLGVTSKGKKFTYLASKKGSDGNTWYQIQFKKDVKGWVTGQFSKVITSTVQTEEKQIVITGNPVNVRASASTNSKQLGTVAKGKKFKLLSTKKDGKGDTWYQIQYKADTKGWVFGAYARLA